MEAVIAGYDSMAVANAEAAGKSVPGLVDGMPASCCRFRADGFRLTRTRSPR
jgi:hypothetical protein